MCMLWPYILGKVQSESSADHDEQSHERKGRLNALIKVLKLYSTQYDNSDFVSEIMKHILSSRLLTYEGKRTTKLSDMISKHPFFYLHIVQIVTQSFSKGGRLGNSELEQAGSGGRSKQRNEVELQANRYPQSTSSTCTPFSYVTSDDQQNVFDFHDASSFREELFGGLELPDLPDSSTACDSQSAFDGQSIPSQRVQPGGGIRDPPYLRDILDLCRDYDIEGLLQCL